MSYSLWYVIHIISRHNIEYLAQLSKPLNQISQYLESPVNDWCCEDSFLGMEINNSSTKVFFNNVLDMKETVVDLKDLASNNIPLRHDERSSKLPRDSTVSDLLDPGSYDIYYALEERPRIKY